MRALLLSAATLATGAAMSFNAGAAGGAYATSTVRDAAACARLCVDDGLCVAWSFHPNNSCELRATAPAAPSGLAHGLSHRAPSVLREVIQVVQPPNPEVVAAASVAAGDDQPPPAEPEDEVSQLLLGGLEEDPNGLRD